MPRHDSILGEAQLLAQLLVRFNVWPFVWEGIAQMEVMEYHQFPISGLLQGETQRQQRSAHMMRVCL
jgi:hypothetical protein